MKVDIQLNKDTKPNQIFYDCSNVTKCNCYHDHFHVPHFFQFSGKICGQRGRQNPLFFLYSRLINTKSDHFGRNLAIRLYLKVPENFVCLVLQEGFWLVHIPFSGMVKFESLAQFPVDHIFHIFHILCLPLNGFKYSYLTLIILFDFYPLEHSDY